MDKEEFLTKIEVINQFVHDKDYKSALEVVESIDWRKVKSSRTLCMAGEVYAANRCYQESKDIFLMANNRSPVRKNILYRLIEVSIKMDDLEDALKYYQEFLEVAPNDNIHFILKYKLYSARKTPLEEQMQILEEYKEREYTERWSYELAKLYYKAGENEKCVEACDDIVLWFSEGEYVRKALELKMRLADLTPRQQRIYEQQVQEIEREEQEKQEEKEEKENPGQEAQSGTSESSQEPEEGLLAETGTDANDAGQSRRRTAGDDIVPVMESNGSLQEKISKGIKDIFSGIIKAEWDEENDFLESYSIEPKINIADVIPPQTIEDNIREMEERASRENQEEEESEGEQPETAQEENLPGGIQQEYPEEESETGSVYPDADPSGQVDFPEEYPDWQETQADPQGIQPGLQEALESIQEEQPDWQGVQMDMHEIHPDLQEEQADSQEEQSDPQDFQPEESPAQDTEGGEESGTTEFPKLILPDFNLEEVILSAAEKQGIEVPDEAEIISSTSEEKIGENSVDNVDNSGEKSEIPLENDQETPEEKSEEEEFPVTPGKAQPEGEVHPQEEPDNEVDSLIEMIDAKNSQEPEDPNVIVLRDKKLDEVERKLFSYFSMIPGMDEQLSETLADAQMAASDKTSRFGNIIVMGNPRTGKTRLTEGLIRSICRELHMPAAKIATVEASQLNGKDIPKIVSKMAGGFLVIQKTNQLDPDSVTQMNQALEFRTDGLTVILEDEKIGMRKFIAKYPKFAKKFTSTINIPVFTNDELVCFAKIYADEMGYVMDTMGVLALYNLIGDNQKEDEPMTIGAVKDMMDEAITRAESSHRKLQRSISKKRFDSEGKIILYEKDFK